MQKFDVIVIGSGSGLKVVWRALQKGLKVALVDKGPLNGTCLNNGCIPSKVMIYPADVVRQLDDAKPVGVRGTIENVDFKLIMSRVWSIIMSEREDTEKEIRAHKDLTWYRHDGEFIGDYMLKAGEETITAPKIVIATGARPGVPKIEGIEDAGYLDNVTLLDLKELPKSMIIVGAGYIGCEYGHCFSAYGTDVTLIGRHPVVLDDEDPEISAVVTKTLSKDLRYVAGYDVVRMARENGMKAVYAKDIKTGKVERFAAEHVLIAAGRRSNADRLKPENTGVQTDKKGWIVVDRHMETTKPGIYALGDATGRFMFKHTANYEADIVSANMLDGERLENDTHAVPHAVFTHPQVGSVGITEMDAYKAGHKILVGRAKYGDTAKGYAMGDEEGFVKIVVDKDTGRILGCSIAGPEAPVLVQQVVLLMNTETQTLAPFERSQVIHPALSEVLARAIDNLESPNVLLLGQQMRNR
jgi:dihydrolipoamide dehydrogenase